LWDSMTRHLEDLFSPDPHTFVAKVMQEQQEDKT
jgi:hypothetical protein